MSTLPTTVSSELLVQEALPTTAPPSASRKGSGAKNRSREGLRVKHNASTSKAMNEVRKTITPSQIALDSATAIASPIEETTNCIILVPINIIGIFTLIRECLASIACRVPAVGRLPESTTFLHALTRVAISLLRMKIIKCLIEHGHSKYDMTQIRAEYEQNKDFWSLALPLPVADYIDTVGVFKYLGRTYVPTFNGDSIFSCASVVNYDLLLAWPTLVQQDDDGEPPARMARDDLDRPARRQPERRVAAPPANIDEQHRAEWVQNFMTIRDLHDIPPIDDNVMLAAHYRLMQLLDSKGHSFMRRVSSEVMGGAAQLVAVCQMQGGLGRESSAWSTLEMSQADLTYGAALRYGEPVFGRSPICYHQDLAVTKGTLVLTEAVRRLALKGLSAVRSQK